MFCYNVFTIGSRVILNIYSKPTVIQENKRENPQGTVSFIRGKLSLPIFFYM